MAHGAGPDVARAIGYQGHDAVISEAALKSFRSQRYGAVSTATDHGQAPSVRPYPQAPPQILRKGVDVVTREALLRIRLIRAERPGARIPLGQSAEFRPDPQQATAIFKQGYDVIVRQTLSVARIIAIRFERAVLTIEARQSVRRADPEPLFAILVQRLDRAQRQ